MISNASTFLDARKSGMAEGFQSKPEAMKFNCSFTGIGCFASPCSMLKNGFGMWTRGIRGDHLSYGKKQSPNDSMNTFTAASYAEIAQADPQRKLQ